MCYETNWRGRIMKKEFFVNNRNKYFNKINDNSITILSSGTSYKKSADENFDYEVWEPVGKDKICVRFCTSWATTDENVNKLINAIKRK